HAAALPAARARHRDAASRTGSLLARMAAVRPPIEERFPRPSVMGVVNVTPDSFSGDGIYLRPDVAAVEARAMRDAGAAILDVGGESTRPGSAGVSLEEELRRVQPVLEALAGQPPSLHTANADGAAPPPPPPPA